MSNTTDDAEKLRSILNFEFHAFLQLSSLSRDQQDQRIENAVEAIMRHFNTPQPTLTGAEWYQKYMKALDSVGNLSFTRAPRHYAIAAAKKASGVE